jgi:rhodanese-related sulfurtransferase
MDSRREHVMPETLQIVDEADPAEAYRILESQPESALVDVRTRAEWSFVGLPDLAAIGRPVWPVEWVTFPAMARNPEFIAELVGRAGGKLPERLLFICRSGARSLAAATTVAAAMAEHGIAVHCTNVAEGFEGDLDGEGHRGRVSGWKVRGLPWRQS